MGQNDGNVIGTTRILNNGPNSLRYNIVLLAEGFTSNQQLRFNARCQEFLDSLSDDRWFKYLLSAINVHRVNVESRWSGTGDPVECGGSGYSPRTYFDSSLCTGLGPFSPAIRRLMHFDYWLASNVCDEQVPEWDLGIVIANNSTANGGAGGLKIAITTIDSGWADKALHEMGHSLGFLADEYDYWMSDSCQVGQEPDHEHPPLGFEPFQPNITRAYSFESRADIKWGNLINEQTPIPTLLNSNCSACPILPNPLSSDSEIGLYEGADHYHCDIYRPAFRCRMRSSSVSFCDVCIEALHAELENFLPDTPNVVAEIVEIDFGELCNGEIVSDKFKIANLGGRACDLEVGTTHGNLTVECLFLGVRHDSPISRPGGLIPGQMAELSVTIGPIDLPSGINRESFSADIKVRYDDDELFIPVQAIICRPNQIARVGVSGSSQIVDFGNVAVGLTMYRNIRVSNVASCCPAPLSVELLNPSGEFELAPDTDMGFDVLAGTTRRVYVSFKAPETPGMSYSGQLAIRTNDPTNGDFVVQLRARTVEPPPIGSILVLDRSGSMIGETGVPEVRKIDAAVDASKLYVSLLRENDEIGIVRFNDEAWRSDGDVLLDMVQTGPLENDQSREHINSVLNTNLLRPSGFTSIGAGLVLGSNVLSMGGTNSRSLIILTDGRQNVGTTISEGRETVDNATPAQRVFSVGLGLNQISTNLSEIASATNGVAAITGELVEESEFLLQKLFVQILSDVSDRNLIRDPNFSLLPGEKIYVKIPLDDVDLQVDFILLFRENDAHPKNTKMWIEAPNGEIFSESTILPNGLLKVVHGQAFIFYRLNLPMSKKDPASSYGTWQVGIENCASGDDPSLALRCTVLGQTYGNLRCPGKVVQAGHDPGSSVEVVFTPTLYGIPTRVMNPAIANVRRPDGSTEIVTLYPDSEVVYRGKVSNTETPGIYHIYTELVFQLPSGKAVTRARYLTAFILTQVGDVDNKKWPKIPFYSLKGSRC